VPSKSRTLAASSASCAVSTAVSKPKHLSICGAHAALSFTVNISAILVCCLTQAFSRCLHSRVEAEALVDLHVCPQRSLDS